MTFTKSEMAERGIVILGYRIEFRIVKGRWYDGNWYVWRGLDMNEPGELVDWLNSLKSSLEYRIVTIYKERKDGK